LEKNIAEKLVPRTGVIAVTKAYHVVLKPLEMVCGMNLEKFKRV
jgi:hypothetical protein